MHGDADMQMPKILDVLIVRLTQIRDQIASELKYILLLTCFCNNRLVQNRQLCSDNSKILTFKREDRLKRSVKSNRKLKYDF